MSRIEDTTYHLCFHWVAHCISIFIGWNVSVFTYICMYGSPSLQAQSVYLVNFELPLSLTLIYTRTDCMFAVIKSIVYYDGQMYTIHLLDFLKKSEM